MSENICRQCGAVLASGVNECKYCGEPVAVSQQQVNNMGGYAQPNMQQPNMQQPYMQQPNIQQPYMQQPYMQQQPYYNNMNMNNNEGINPAWPIKSKVTAALLAIFLGGIGVHKFYMGKTGLGILYLVFCWTYIPGIIGFIEGIIYLTSNDHNFQVKNHVRLQ